MGHRFGTVVGCFTLIVRRAESFGADAGRYDRARPTYPRELIDAVLGPRPQSMSVLDVGCGTGIAAKLMVERGAHVLGVEPDERMAAVARDKGLAVEISPFESWDPAGRMFSRVAAGQSWHWVDPVMGPEKAASILRPGGRLCVFWNVAEMPSDLDGEIAEVYRRTAPGIDDYSVLVGCSRSDTPGVEARYATQIDGIGTCEEMSTPTLERFSWSRTYGRDEWLDQLPTHSDHAAMEAGDLDRLLEAIGAAIDNCGGSFEMTYCAWLVSTIRH